MYLANVQNLTVTGNRLPGRPSALADHDSALRALEASRADTSVRQALQQLAKDDPLPYIRTESRKMLASMPEID